MKDLNELSLKELREIYPEVKATSKTKFIEIVNEQSIVEPPFKLTYDNLLEYIASKIPTREKILIKCEDSLTADEVFYNCQYKLFPLLNKKGISVMSSARRRDMHLNGTLYVRFSCQTLYNSIKSSMNFTTFEDLV